MARETKVGLLIGLGVVLLVGVILSDYVAVSERDGGAAGLSQIGDRDTAPPVRTADNVLSIGQSFTRGPVLPPDRLTSLDMSDALAPRPAPGPSQAEVAARVAAAPPLTERLPDLGAGSAVASLSAIDDPSDPRTGIELEDLADLLRRDADRRARRLTPAVARVDALEPAAASLVGRTVVDRVEHRVALGETLTSIAVLHYGSAGYADTLAEANPDVVGPQGQVRAGAVLAVPVRGEALGVGLDPVALETATAAYQPPRRIKVKAGETLSEIAARELGSAGAWKQLLEANRDQMDSDRDLRSGMTLKVPAVAATGVVVAASPAAQASQEAVPGPSVESARVTPEDDDYVVRSGDSLYRIAADRLGNGGRYRELYELNRDRMSSETDLRPGQTLRLPAS
ncbi:MAG: LysM peptidoglycan-binding domain-containing protein [Planctomycetota bacterium]